MSINQAIHDDNTNNTDDIDQTRRRSTENGGRRRLGPYLTFLPFRRLRRPANIFNHNITFPLMNTAPDVVDGSLPIFVSPPPPASVPSFLPHLATTTTMTITTTDVSNMRHEQLSVLASTAEQPGLSIESLLMFPLGSESPDDLLFPNHVLHYSVSPDARLAYVVGQELSGATSVYVWDLHRGVKHKFHHSHMHYVRHFYALNDRRGYVVSSSKAFDRFLIYYVQIDGVEKRMTAQQHVTTYSARGHVQFWSSCRYKTTGIVFAIIDQAGVFIYKVEISADGAEKLERFHVVDRSNHYFIGQPFVHDEHVMFLEREYFNLKFTGRVIRISLANGKLDSVETTQSAHCTLFTNELMNGMRMPNRIKYVERGGQLWAIMESAPSPSPAPTSLFANGGSMATDTLSRRKFIGVLCLRTWTWREVHMELEASYDETSLDVTTGGTVVIIKRGVSVNGPIISGFYYLQTKNPKSLLHSSFHKLINEREELRFLERRQLRALGVPDELL